MALAESSGVRGRVAADDVPTVVQLTNFGGREKARSTDEIRRNEGVSTPASLLETVGDDAVIRHAAIINGDEEWQSLPGRPAGQFGDQKRSVATDDRDAVELR